MRAVLGVWMMFHAAAGIMAGLVGILALSVEVSPWWLLLLPLWSTVAAILFAVGLKGADWATDTEARW